MDKILNSLPIGILLAVAVKSIVTPPGIAEALIILGLCSLIAVSKIAETNSSVKKLDEKMKDFEEKLEQMHKDNSEVRTYISSIKLNNSYSLNKSNR